MRTAYDHAVGAIRGRGTDLQSRGHLLRARPWLLLSNALSWFDFIRATARSRSSLFLQYAGLLVAVLSTPPGIVLDPAAFVAALLGVALAIASIVAEYLRHKRAAADLWLLELAPDPSAHNGGSRRFFTGLVAQEDLIGIGEDFVYRPPGDTVATALSGTSPEQPGACAAWSTEPKKLAFQIRENKTRILLYRYKYSRIRPFNGRTVSQLSSLDGDTLRAGAAVTFAPGRYFDLLVSNYLATEVLQDKDRNKILSVREFLRDAAGGLVDLADSRLSDAVGVSTIAFDRNRRLVLIGQSEFALSSAGKLAPAGSGSLEPRDFPRGLRRGETAAVPLAEVVRTGMNRELVEESNIDERDIRFSCVTGYFRWLTRGGKPEYVGVSVLGKGTDELAATQRFTERKWVRSIYRGVDVDLDELTRHPADPARAIADERYRSSLSVPLVLALRSLAERLRDEDFAAVFHAQFD